MKRFMPDTVFGRLFGLVVLAVLASHILVFAVFMNLAPGGPSAERPAPQASALRPDRPQPPDARRRPPPPSPLNGMLIGLLIQFIAVTVAAWYGARMLARPIQQMATAAERLGDNLSSPPMKEQGPREARSASRVFNRMQDNIRAQIEARERFLAAVSHDLRTPLTRMKLSIESLTDAGVGERLRSDINEMTTMLDATLSYLRGEALDEAWQRIDIQALVDTVAEDARENGYQVSVSGTAKPIEGLPHALRRCLDNLVDNAVRYGERADLNLIDGPASLVIEVRDAGPGIPENRISHVMEPFVRLEDSRNRNSGGVGLGLSIARDAAHRNRGELSLRNAPGGGLVARVTLPRT
ncbi:MAG: ATP-binding protein [Azoarcus sp.]|nr:ATP-binding protein [Azoarcus sp.]